MLKVTQPCRQVGGTVCSASTAPVVRTAAHPLLGCFFPPQGSLPFTSHAAEAEAATGTNTTQTEVPDSRNKPMPKDLIRICLAAHTENYLSQSRLHLAFGSGWDLWPQPHCDTKLHCQRAVWLQRRVYLAPHPVSNSDHEATKWGGDAKRNFSMSGQDAEVKLSRTNRSLCSGCTLYASLTPFLLRRAREH